MKIEFRTFGPTRSVIVDHEHVGIIKIHSSGSRFIFIQNLTLEDNFSPTQYAEIKKAVADKLVVLDLARRLTS